MKTAFITGVNGFVGSYLARRLLDGGCRVVAIDQAIECGVDGVEYAQGNILDGGFAGKAIASAAPDEIYHLAAISYLPDADASPAFALQTNILGTVNVLDAVKNVRADARTLLVGSSKEYAAETVSDALPEETPPGPGSFYGISKYAAEMIGRQYGRQFNLDIRFTRSFNHTGPGQSPKFVCSDWARQIALIVLGKQSPALSVGDLDARIDFSDVRDVVRAYQAILTNGRPHEIYNVCSGKAVPLQHILDTLVSKSNTPISVTRNVSKLREHGTSPRLAGDNARLREHTGWKPELPLSQTLDDLFDFWMKQLSD